MACVGRIKRRVVWMAKVTRGRQCCSMSADRGTAWLAPQWPRGIGGSARSIDRAAVD